MAIQEIKVPQLRFKEFSGDWYKKPFKDLVKINQGLQISIAERLTEKEDGSLFYITNEFLREKSEKKYFIKNPPSSVTCDKEDVLMTRTGNTGKVVTDVKGAFHNNFFKIDYPKTIEKRFLVNFLNLPQTQNYILRLAGTSTIPDLNHSDFYKILFVAPQLPEQQKIATFLTAVDKKIALLQQKKTALEQYKKGVMQQLFPSTGSGQAPQLRFKDDDGKEFSDWKEKRLGELGNFKNGLNKDKKDFGFGSPFVNLLDVFGKNELVLKKFDLVNSNINEKNLYNLLKGDVLFIRSSVKRTGVGQTVVVKENLSNTVFSGFMIRFRENKKHFELNFKKYCFNSHNFRSKILSYATSSANTNINQESLSKIKIRIPLIEEQTKIADYLSAIDAKITIVDEQLSQTQAFKKGLLQQLFV